MSILTRTLVALAAAIMIAGCGGGDDNKSSAAGDPKKQNKKGSGGIVDPNEVEELPIIENKPATPTSCLKLAKLSAVREAKKGTWMGTDLAAGGTIRLVKFPTPAAAADALAGAKKEKAAIGGQYVAFGPTKAAPKVTTVAGCAATIAADA